MGRSRIRRAFLRSVVVCCLIGILVPYSLPASVGAATPAVGQTAIEGILTTIHGDARPGTKGAGRDLSFVTDAYGVRTQVNLPESVAKAAGGLRALDRQKVSLTVDAAPGQGSAMVRTVRSIGLVAPAPKAPAPLIGSQPFITIMCLFADSTSTQPVTSTYVQSDLMGVSYPGLGEFWQVNSDEAINLTGSTTVDWVALPSPRATYLPGGVFDPTLAATDCTNAAGDLSSGLP